MIRIKEEDKSAIDIAIKFLSEGKIISFASDTVYAVACDASNFKPIEDLYKIKIRDKKKPIAIFVKDLEEAKKIFFFDDLSKKIAEKFFPGKLTMVLKTRKDATSQLSSNLNYNNEFLGFRIVEKKFIKNLLEKSGKILAVTSANISGEISATKASQVEEYFEDKIDLLIDGGDLKDEEVSSVIKIENNQMTLLRAGAINFKDLERS